MARFFLAVVLVVSSLPGLAGADQDYFQSNTSEALYTQEPIPRTRGEIITIVALLGSALAASGVGTYFLIDSQDNADMVSATQTHTGKVWTQERQSWFDDAMRSRTAAIVSYSVAGTLLASSIVAVFVTDHGKRAVDLEKRPAADAYVAPAPGGMVVGTRFDF